jgi:hypothetical protein
MSNSKQLKHLWARAGFGMRFEDLKALENVPLKHAVKQLFDTVDTEGPINVVHDGTDYDAVIKGDVLARKMFIQNQRQQEKDLNIAWINKMSATNAVL